MKRVKSPAKTAFFFLLGIIGAVIFIFLGRYLSKIAPTEENYLWIETLLIIGNFMMVAGVFAIFVILVFGAHTVIYQSRVIDIPEYSKLLNGFSEERRSKSLRRKMRSALICYDKTKYSKALEKLSSLLNKCRSEKGKCSICTLMGMCYEGDSQHDKAAEAYTAAIEADGTDPSLYEKLASQQYKAGKRSEAIETLLTEAKLSGSARPYANIAQMYYVEKDYDNAIKYAEEAVKIDERCGDAYKVLCLAYHALEDKENCMKYYNFCTTYTMELTELAKAEAWLGVKRVNPYAEYLN